jgi:hypothetical protein
MTLLVLLVGLAALLSARSIADVPVLESTLAFAGVLVVVTTLFFTGQMG